MLTETDLWYQGSRSISYEDMILEELLEPEYPFMENSPKNIIVQYCENLDCDKWISSRVWTYDAPWYCNKHNTVSSGIRMQCWGLAHKLFRCKNNAKEGSHFCYWHEHGTRFIPWLKCKNESCPQQAYGFRSWEKFYHAMFLYLAWEGYCKYCRAPWRRKKYVSEFEIWANPNHESIRHEAWLKVFGS